MERTDDHTRRARQGLHGGNRGLAAPRAPPHRPEPERDRPEGRPVQVHAVPARGGYRQPQPGDPVGAVHRPGRAVLPAGRPARAPSPADPGRRGAGRVLGPGRALVGLAEEPFELGPGDYTAYPADVPHVFRALEPSTKAVLIGENA